MREQEHIAALRRALRRQGVWGRRARWLIEEWTEHVREEVAHRIAQGVSADAAEKEAWLVLGDSPTLAAHAARELNSSTWSGRHPWLAGLALPASVVAGLFIALLLYGFYLSATIFDAAGHLTNWSALVCWQYAFNGLPLLLAGLWLAWLAARMPGGWKLFWISAITLTLCTTTWWMSLTPPLHGPGSGCLTIKAHGLLGALVGLAGAPWLPDHAWREQLWQVSPWFQLGVLLLPIILGRRGGTARRASPA